MRASLVIVLITAFGFTILVWPTHAHDNYGAIAYSPSTGAWGYAYNYPSRAATDRSAIRRYRKGDCRIRVWFVNASGVLAVGDGGALGPFRSGDAAINPFPTDKSVGYYQTVPLGRLHGNGNLI